MAVQCLSTHHPHEAGQIADKSLIAAIPVSNLIRRTAK